MSHLWMVGKEEARNVEEAIKGGLSGEFSRRFEEAFARKFEVEYAIGVNSGTSALHCALWAVGVEPGDEVIIPPLTFAAPAMAVLQLGAIPVFADIDPSTFTIDPKSVEAHITDRTKAIVPVALYGLPPDLDPLMELARRHGIKLIEDDAQCFLGRYKGKVAGTIGDIAIYSFERSKHMTCGNGGAAITSDELLAERMRKFSVLGYASVSAKQLSYKGNKDLIQHPDYKRHEYLGCNYRLPEVCAAMLLAQLEKLDRFVELRRQIASIYSECVSGCDWLQPQMVPDGYINAYWTYAMALSKDIPWDEFRRVFLEEGGDRYYGAWSINYLEPAFQKITTADRALRYPAGICPVAEDLQPRLIQLKTNYGSIDQAKLQAEALQKTISRLSRVR